MARSDCRTVVSRNCVLIVDAHWKGQQARRINRPDGAVLAPHNAMVQELRVDVGSNDLAILVDATWESPDVKRAASAWGIERGDVAMLVSHKNMWRTIRAIVISRYRSFCVYTRGVRVSGIPHIERRDGTVIVSHKPMAAPPAKKRPAIAPPR